MNAPASTRQGASQTSAEYQNAIKYVERIKARYKDEPKTYRLFLKTLHNFRKDHNYRKVNRKIERLFKDAPDLLAEFKNYMPAGWKEGLISDKLNGGDL
ncbi:hypothetical protein ACEPAI_105 [Sanghuangporus weigelae]